MVLRMEWRKRHPGYLQLAANEKGDRGLEFQPNFRKLFAFVVSIGDQFRVCTMDRLHSSQEVSVISTKD